VSFCDFFPIAALQRRFVFLETPEHLFIKFSGSLGLIGVGGFTGNDVVLAKSISGSGLSSILM
jgi:hypothetical protein